MESDCGEREGEEFEREREMMHKSFDTISLHVCHPRVLWVGADWREAVVVKRKREWMGVICEERGSFRKTRHIQISGKGGILSCYVRSPFSKLKVVRRKRKEKNLM